MKNQLLKLTLLFAHLFFINQGLLAWDSHTLIAHPIFSSMEEVTGSDSVRVTSLEQFLKAVEPELAIVLAEEEQWLKDNLVWYTPLPEDLTFKSTGDTTDLRQRFIEAIRINPDSKLISYLQLLPGGNPDQKPILKSEEINPLKHISGLNNVTFVGLQNGDLIDPLSVLVTANDEPDMGLDVGLYQNNETIAGDKYGFGTQPFGNPNLEYGSQAPIHMGLYHEEKLVNKLAPYISHCLPEYRIHLYKTLSELAFREGQDYWGWRFMGWGLHFIADLAQPYHASALPGISTAKMVLMNALDMMGFSGMKNNAIQLVSNRHTAIESFERQLLEAAYLAKDNDYSQFQSLRASVSIPAYHDNIPRSILAKQSNARAKKLDHLIAKNMPARLVSDPKFEFGTSPEKHEILNIVKTSDDSTAVKNLEDELNKLLKSFSVYGRSYVKNILSTN